MKIDLHNHTRYSDGLYTCRELLEAAEKNHTDIFALTDHDSVLGCEEMKQLADQMGKKVILGMELSTDYHGKSVHIVCLFKKNRIPPFFKNFSLEMIEKRKKRAVEMMKKVEQIYHLKIDLSRLFSESILITRANMRRNLEVCNHLTKEEASFYVSSRSEAYVPSTKLSVEEGVRMARENDCFIILAHPCQLSKEDVEEILKYGFDAIEIRHPSNRENDEAYFQKVAERHHLLISAGSDCHGDQTDAPIGTCTLSGPEFAPIAERIGWNDGD